jgi:hypothetical protein
VSYSELYPTLRPGELLDGVCRDLRFQEPWKMAHPASFRPTVAGLK